MPSSPTLKLTYFDMAARAEATRVMLRMGGIAFEDERISRETFASLKHTLPYNQVPVLHVDGELLAESQAIGRYAARIAGFYPTNDPVAALMVEEILITISELTETKMVPIIREQHPEAKKLKLEAFVVTHVPAAFAQLDARLQYMATYAFFKKTNQVYTHEIVLSMLVGSLQSRFSEIMPPHFLDEYGTVLAVHQKVVNAIASPPTLLPQSALSEIPRPAKLKLTYLDLKARAEFLRLAFHIGGVPFEDERVTLEEVQERKPSLPYGQVPVLEIDGFVCAQTFALLRYAGMLGGLYPIQTEPFKAAKMDEIIARVEEIYYRFQASYEEKNPEKRRLLREQLMASHVLQDILASLETRVAQWKQPTSPYIFGQDVTVADLAVYHIVDFIRSGDWDYVPVTIADEFHALVAVHGAVVVHPWVVDWYAKTSK